jgi:hypothetical protein
VVVSPYMSSHVLMYYITAPIDATMRSFNLSINVSAIECDRCLIFFIMIMLRVAINIILYRVLYYIYTGTL